MSNLRALFLASTLFSSAQACELSAPPTAIAGTKFSMSWTGGEGWTRRADGTPVIHNTTPSGAFDVFATNWLGDHTFTMTTTSGEVCTTSVSFVFTPPSPLGWYIFPWDGQSNSKGAGKGPFDPLVRSAISPRVFQVGRFDGGMSILPVGYLAGGNIWWDGLQFSGTVGEADSAMGPALAAAQKFITDGHLPAGYNILIVPAAKSGTSIEQHLPGTPLYEDMIARVQWALALPGDNHVEVFNWLLGEHNIVLGSYPEDFRAKLTSFFSAVRLDLPGAYPIIAGRFVPTWLPEDSERDAIQAVVENVVSTSGGCMVPNDGLTSNADIGVNNEAEHYNAQSAITLGKRYENTRASCSVARRLK